MNLVKADLSKKNADELVQYSIVVETAMNGNASFPDPSPKLSDITTARQKLEAAIPPAVNGDRVLVAKRNTLARELRDLLVAECQYVNSASNGDRDVALSSGFPAAKEPSPIGLVPPPTKLVARPTDKQGQALITFKCAYGSRMKQIYCTSGDPNVEANWELIGVTTKSRFLATDLDPNKFYWFRVNAVCAAGVSGYSDPAVVRAAA
ncbi:MAG: fibronectin type III domain-containing protein [Flavobacteriales bacterium]|nr:fibronectin type III domain-containing protein [Flavobacteriales bacterium]